MMKAVDEQILGTVILYIISKVIFSFNHLKFATPEHMFERYHEVDSGYGCSGGFLSIIVLYNRSIGFPSFLNRHGHL